MSWLQFATDVKHVCVLCCECVNESWQDFRSYSENKHLTLVMNNIHTSSLSHLSNMLSSLLVNSRLAERAKKRKPEWLGPAPTS